jgi:serine/threonine protein kinase
MSPEAAAGRELDGRSDIFAVGIILWELLNGRRLYKGQGKEPPTLAQAAEAAVPPLKKRGYAKEDELHAIVMRALAKDPTERFRTAEDMRAALQQYVRASGLFSSPLKFGSWLTQHFADEILDRRRTREVAARAIAQGPLVQVTPSPGPPAVGKSQEVSPTAGAAIQPPKAADLDDGAEMAALRRTGKPKLLLALAALAVMALVALLAL